jgi:addiction module HigA family antidote
LRRIASYSGKLPGVFTWAEAASQAKRVYGSALPGLSDAQWLEYARQGYREIDGVPVGGDLTVTEFAKRLRVSRVALSRVVNGHAAVSAELAIRLAAALGGSAESWLSMQAAYDLWHAAKKRRPKIAKIEDMRLERAQAA